MDQFTATTVTSLTASKLNSINRMEEAKEVLVKIHLVMTGETGLNKRSDKNTIRMWSCLMFMINLLTTTRTKDSEEAMDASNAVKMVTLQKNVRTAE